MQAATGRCVETQVIEALRGSSSGPSFSTASTTSSSSARSARSRSTHIVDLQLDKLDQLLADRKLTIEITPEAKRFLAEEGYDPAFGARPLKRAIQRLLQNPLAMAVLEGRFREGDRIRVGRERQWRARVHRRRPRARRRRLAEPARDEQLHAARARVWRSEAASNGEVPVGAVDRA